MKYYRGLISCFLVVVVFFVYYKGCMISEPPDVDEVENVFGECYNDIGIVADFLISTEYESIIMDSSRRTGAKK